MKFYNYLNEQSEDWIELIEKHCKPYLNKIKGNKHVLVRNFPKKQRSIIELRRVRKDRKPKDMPVKIHNMLDKFFQEHFGWKARSEGLFCWSSYKFKYILKDLIDNEDIATKLVFPIGKFDYLWNPEVDDLYVIFDENAEEMFSKSIDYVDSEELENLFNKLKETDNPLSGYQDSRFSKSLDSSCEIIINCDNYYTVRLTTEVVNTLKERWNVDLKL